MAYVNYIFTKKYITRCVIKDVNNQYRDMKTIDEREKCDTRRVPMR